MPTVYFSENKSYFIPLTTGCDMYWCAKIKDEAGNLKSEQGNRTFCLNSFDQILISSYVENLW